MNLQTMLLLLFLCYVSISEGKMLNRLEEDLELEKEFQRLTKSAVETIQTTYGDTYDCVDFYEQPVFDDPLMKNHSFHPKMEQTFYPKGKRSQNFTSNFRPEKIWINGKGCPIGTVPIRQITKDDLIRAKQAAEIYASNLNPQTAERPGVHFSVLHTPRLGAKVKYYGAGMDGEMYNPKLNHDSQYSSSQVKIQNGHESIIFGWTVHPKVYKDSKTRFFIYTYVNNKHCFNNFCGLFVHTSSKIPLDYVFEHMSKVCGNMGISNNFNAYKDESSGNWILQLEFETIGMWPSRFFTGLTNFATYIEWGGEVYSPPQILSPEMGSGVPITSQFGSCSAVCSRLKLINEDRKTINAMSLVKYEDINKYYQVMDRGYTGSDLEHAMSYGGKGGYTGN